MIDAPCCYSRNSAPPIRTMSVSQSNTQPGTGKRTRRNSMWSRRWRRELCGAAAGLAEVVVSPSSSCERPEADAAAVEVDRRGHPGPHSGDDNWGWRARQGRGGAMIGLPTGVRVWIAAGHTDMRRGMQGLAGQVQEMLHCDPHLCVERDYVAEGRVTPARAGGADFFAT